MTATIAEPATGDDHTWRLEDVNYDELLGQVSRFGCSNCAAVWFR